VREPSRLYVRDLSVPRRRSRCRLKGAPALPRRPSKPEMTRRRRWRSGEQFVTRGLALIALTLALAPAAHAGGPLMLYGAAEDNVRASSVTASKAQMDLLS